MSNETIHTALTEVASEGDDSISLGKGLSLVRPNDQMLARRWDWAQSKCEMDEETEATRYLVSEYPSWVAGTDLAGAQQRGVNRFYAGLMAIQVIKPIRTLGFIYYPGQRIERRPPMQPGQWASMNRFDGSMLAQVPAMFNRIQRVMDGNSAEQKNALTLLQLGLEHFHPYVAGLLWVTGLEAIFDSGGKEEFKRKLCACLGPQTLAFPNWHSEPDAPQHTVEELAIPLFVLRNKLAHGADLRTALTDKKHPVDLMARIHLTQDSEATNYAGILSEAACHLLCQVLRKVL